MAIAAELDDERRRSGPRGPLHGIPVLLEDDIDTGDRTMTTAGSLALEGHRAPRDAFLVARLRAAGAVVLGKTNLSERANARSTRSSSGWSSRGGQTRNPYALDRNPCGSSTGSGVAVAADLATGAVGTETDGSIVCPASVNGVGQRRRSTASVNGVVGVKPTLGPVRRAGIIPVAASQDTAGAMARTVADAVFERAVETLRDLGAEIVDGVDLSAIAAVREHEVRVMRVELKAGIDAYLRKRPDAPVRSLADVIAFNAQHADRVMPYFRQEFLQMAQAEAGLDDPTYLEALTACRRIARDEGIDRALREQRLDALIAPTGTPAWVTDPIDGDRLLGLCSSPAAVAVSPPAISRHLRTLEASGLIRRRRRGRQHVLSLDAARLDEASRWLERARAFWDARLDDLARHLEEHP